MCFIVSLKPPFLGLNRWNRLYVSPCKKVENHCALPKSSTFYVWRYILSIQMVYCSYIETKLMVLQLLLLLTECRVAVAVVIAVVVGPRAPVSWKVGLFSQKTLLYITFSVWRNKLYQWKWSSVKFGYNEPAIFCSLLQGFFKAGLIWLKICSLLSSVRYNQVSLNVKFYF